jgi:preprotein translocase subunit SecD
LTVFGKAANLSRRIGGSTFGRALLQSSSGGLMRTRGFLISAVSLVPFALTAQAPASPACERIQLRFADVMRSTAKIHRNSADGVWYALNDTIVLDERVISSIGVDSFRLRETTAWSVVARLTPAGTQALSEASASHIGKMLGILIGDDLIDVPVIETKLTTPVIQLRGNASRAVADSLATQARRAIDAGCLTRNGRGWLGAER